MKKAPGILPSQTWLTHNGYSGLVAAIQKHPAAFAHIRQNWKGGQTPEEWVPVAESLAAQHGDILPYRHWLVASGYHGLVYAMRRKPEAFAHIQQAKKRHSRDHWVAVAEKLATKHGGRLPCPSWLRRNDYAPLADALTRLPALFAHIPRETSRGRTPMEWVAVAEDLAATHGGALPNCGWLISSGYGALYNAKKGSPALFAHIPSSSKKGHTPEEWLLIAEHLAAQHNGALPNAAWLAKNGHAGLCRALVGCPELFVHITRSIKRTQTIENWLPVAEELAARFGGRLPQPKWLRANGHGRLATAMQRRPELFAHVPQDRRTHTKDEWVLFAENLAIEHGRTLPAPDWLRLNQGALYRAMLHDPQDFAHIPQTRLRRKCPGRNKKRTSNEWLQIAERLVRDHEQLPSSQWLRHNGYQQIIFHMRKHPELFAHLTP